MRSETPFLDRYRDLGIKVSMADEGLLRVEPRDRLTDELRSEIRRFKPWIMSELGRNPNWWIVTSPDGRTLRFVEPAPPPLGSGGKS